MATIYYDYLTRNDFNHDSIFTFPCKCCGKRLPGREFYAYSDVCQECAALVTGVEESDEEAA